MVRRVGNGVLVGAGKCACLEYAVDAVEYDLEMVWNVV